VLLLLSFGPQLNGFQIQLAGLTHL